MVQREEDIKDQQGIFTRITNNTNNMKTCNCTLPYENCCGRVEPLKHHTVKTSVAVEQLRVKKPNMKVTTNINGLYSTNNIPADTALRGKHFTDFMNGRTCVKSIRNEYIVSIGDDSTNFQGTTNL